MAILKKASFGFGELDPALHDKTDVQSYYSGLKTARNVILSKTGRIVNAPGTWLGHSTSATPSKIYSPDFTNLRPSSTTLNIECNFILEFTDGFVQGYNIIYRNGVGPQDGYQLVEFPNPPVVSPFTTSDILYLKFQSIKIPNPLNTSLTKTRVAVSGVTEFAKLILLEIYDDVITIDENFAGNDASPQLRAARSTVYSAASEPTYDYNPAVNAYTAGSDALYAKDVNKNAATIAGGSLLGHPVEYGVTCVTRSGVESKILPIQYYAGSDNAIVGGTAATSYFKLPVNDEFNAFYIYNMTVGFMNFVPSPDVSFPDSFYYDISHINVYRRPKSNIAAGSGSLNQSNGNSFGLIGQVLWRKNFPSPYQYQAGQPFNIGFTDFGQEADYSNPPPEEFTNVGQLTDGTDVYPTALFTYNRRLVTSKGSTVAFSKINHPRYLLKDFPLSSATAFVLDVGDRNPTVYSGVEYNGLYVFASDGVYYGGNDTPVSSLNPVLKRVDELRIDQFVDPIVTPYGVLFVDDATKTIKTLGYNDNAKRIEPQEVSIFSDHLFYNKRVKSWAYNSGEYPYLFVVLDDGSAVSYNFNPTSGLNAWCRHDTDGKYKQVIQINQKFKQDIDLAFIVEREGVEYIELSSRRNRKGTDLNQPQGGEDFNLVAFSHSSILFYELADMGIPVGDTRDNANVTLSAVAGEWDTTVEFLTASTTYWTPRIGKTIGIFNSETGGYYYLQILSVDPGVKVVFTVLGAEVPTNLRSVSVKSYICHTVITGLDHLEGKDVSVLSDNEVVGSPNNDIDSYPTYTVTGGEITLPTPRVWSIVGLPYTSDVETLSVDSKDGSLALSAKIANEVVVRYVRTRGGYASGNFPANDKVNGMEQGYEWDTRDTINKPLAEKTRAIKYRPFSEWQLNGRICLRQVDPLPIEISSILIDVSKG